MLIRYGIWRRKVGKRRVYEHECHVIQTGTFDWEDTRAHRRLRNRILCKHPGWSLSGYCAEVPIGNYSEERK